MYTKPLATAALLAALCSPALAQHYHDDDCSEEDICLRGASEIAGRHLMVAAAKVSHAHYSAAIEQASRAIENQRDLGVAYLQRATYLIGAGRYAEAESDIAQFAGMYPNARGSYFLRAEMALYRHDPAGALDDLARAEALPTRDSERGFNATYGLWSNALYLAYRSIAEALLGQADAAATDLDASMKTEYLRPWYVLNTYCYTAAVAGELDLAELACDEAIQRNPHNDGHVADSMGLVHLKMHQWQKAIANYDQALDDVPDQALSLYGRGVAKIASGDRAGGMRDVAQAREGEPDIDNITARLGAPTAASVVASAK